MADSELNRTAHTRASVEALAARFNTWGKWGDDDELGAANHITEETMKAAASCIRRGSAFSLSLPFDRSGPQSGSTPRPNPQHVMLVMPSDSFLDDGGRQRFSDDAVYMPLQCATQWDALCHVFYDGKTYNGRPMDSVTAYHGAALQQHHERSGQARG